VTLTVIDPGLATTVQDVGRPDWTHLGVPESGACDTDSLAVANLLVGGEAGAAALEMTIVGPTVAVDEAIVVGLAGSDLGGIVVEDGRRLEPGRSHRLAAGETVAFPGPAAGAAGARAYLALPGGVDVPWILGSRATCLAAGFGGFDGRALRAGDAIDAASGSRVEWPVGLAWPGHPVDPGRDGPIRVLPGPDPGLDAFVAETWQVAASSDRVGLRLGGSTLPDGIGGETLTHGVVSGAIQAPPDGRPIVLLADHQTTGGYRVIAVAISADRPRLGQLRPGSAVRFAVVDRAAAIAAAMAGRRSLAAGAQALRDAAGWDELVRSAGG
jgi:biotin-dependent carboxylase-like uncharacterized protein